MERCYEDIHVDAVEKVSELDEGGWESDLSGGVCR